MCQAVSYDRRAIKERRMQDTTAPAGTGIKKQADATPRLQITRDLLKPWSPCANGYKWFLNKFPQGAAYTAVQKALRDDNRLDDARWLTDQVWANLILNTPAITADVT